MRINKFVAQSTGISRRKADQLIISGQVLVNSKTAVSGQAVSSDDVVSFNNQILSLPEVTTTILVNKPVGYVSSRSGQGSQTIYDLLPEAYAELKPVGRLDKDSSGLILLTNDGVMAHQLTHPSFNKTKIYEVVLNKPLSAADKDKLETGGVKLNDGVSRFKIEPIKGSKLRVIMSEGRNRQIRRSFAALGYTVVKLKRTNFGEYSIEGIKPGDFSRL